MNKYGRIIPMPQNGTRTVFIGTTVPFFRGIGKLTIVCGHCNLPLICNIDVGQVKNIVIRCPNCGRYNDIQ